MSDRSTLGKILIIGSSLELLFFMFIFNIGVPRYPGAPAFGSVVNDGKMQDRMLGIMIGLVVLPIGFYLVYGSQTSGQIGQMKIKQPPLPVPPEPLKPSVFTYDLQAALTYSKPSVPNMACSKPVWIQSLARFTNPSVYRDHQIEWGHSWNVPAKDFPECIRFIEAYRGWASYMRKNGHAI